MWIWPGHPSNLPMVSWCCKMQAMGLPCEGPVIKSPPCDAGEEGLTPDPGTQIPHATGQLSPRVPTRESMCCSGRFHITQQRSFMPQPISIQPNKNKQKMQPMPSPWLHAPMVWPLPPWLPFNLAAPAHHTPTTWVLSASPAHQSLLFSQNLGTFCFLSWGCLTYNWVPLICLVSIQMPPPHKEIKPVILKEINPEYSLEGLMLKLKLQYFGHLMQISDSVEKTLKLGRIEGRKKRGWHRRKWFDSITDSMDMNLSKFFEVVKNRGAWRAAVREVTKSQTWLSDSTITISSLLPTSSREQLNPNWGAFIAHSKSERINFLFLSVALFMSMYP